MKPILVIQNCAIESAGTILDYFNQNGIQNQIFHSYFNHEFPKLDNFEAVISLGCPTSVTNYQQHEFLKKLYSYVANIIKLDKPYFGICFGAQILAKVLGASVEENHVKEIGTYNITLTSDGIADPLFKYIPNQFQAFHWHGDTFKIPYGATLLATGEDCINQAFRKNNAVGLQFHFEADIKEIPMWCSAYTSELYELGKTAEEILSTYLQNSVEIKSHNFQFIKNFISSIS